MIDIAVFIGRFQPFHKGHLENCIQALAQAKKLIVLIGSSGIGPLPNNPWSFDERVKIILASLPEKLHPRVQFISLYDSLYDQQDWENRVKYLIAKHSKASDTKALVVFAKDDSSFYLECFPEWTQINLPMVVDANDQCISATNIRADLYEHGKVSDEFVSLAAKNIIQSYTLHPLFKNLKMADQVLNQYQKSNQTMHVLMVYNNQHVMVHQREELLGYQQWALPMFADKSKKEILLESMCHDDSIIRSETIESSLLKITYIITYVALDESMDTPKGYKLFSKSMLIEKDFFADHRSIVYKPMQLKY